MDLQTAVFSLYLLFSAFTPQQADLEIKLHGNDMTTVEKLNKRMEVRNFIAEEKNRILFGNEASEENTEEESALKNLENPLYGPQSGGVSAEFGFESMSAAEVLYKNSMERLSLFQYGEEYFSFPDPLDGDRHAVISVNNDVFTRTEYDDYYRMLERTVWKNARSSQGSVMTKRTRYTYSSASATIPRFCGEEDFVGNKYMETRYNASGKPLEIVDYDVGSNGAGGVKRILKKKNSYTYDASDRLVIDKLLENFDDGTSKSTKNIYTYSSRSSIPDVSYYENDVLRIQTSYRSENDYIQTVFFDGGFKISTEYKDSERVLEITYLGDMEMSRRTF
ncbi:MAG: hypothetical protein II563_10010 [Treponema sp.]|nr:hypothetical protein [Treponema sp.]